MRKIISKIVQVRHVTQERLCTIIAIKRAIVHFFSKTKKLILILTISIPIIKANKKDEMILAKIPYIHYTLFLQKEMK